MIQGFAKSLSNAVQLYLYRVSVLCCCSKSTCYLIFRWENLRSREVEGLEKNTQVPPRLFCCAFSLMFYLPKCHLLILTAEMLQRCRSRSAGVSLTPGVLQSRPLHPVGGAAPAGPCPLGSSGCPAHSGWEPGSGDRRGGLIPPPPGSWSAHCATTCCDRRGPRAGRFCASWCEVRLLILC